MPKRSSSSTDTVGHMDDGNISSRLRKRVPLLRIISSAESSLIKSIISENSTNTDTATTSSPLTLSKNKKHQTSNLKKTPKGAVKKKCAPPSVTPPLVVPDLEVVTVRKKIPLLDLTDEKGSIIQSFVYKDSLS